MTPERKSGLKEKLILLGVLAGIVSAVMLYRQGSKSPSSSSALQQSSQSLPQIMPPEGVDEITHFEGMFRAHPDHAPIALHLANLHSDKQNHPEALKYYRVYLSLDSSATAWEVRLDLAREYYHSGYNDSASAELAGLERQYPDHPGVLYNVGAMAANEGDMTKARKCWTRLLEITPESEEGRLARDGLAKIKSSVP